MYYFQRAHAKTFLIPFTFLSLLPDFFIFSLNFKIQYPRFCPTFQNVPKNAIARLFKHFTPADSECYPMELKGLKIPNCDVCGFHIYFSPKTGPVIKPWTFTVMFSEPAWTLSSQGSTVSRFMPRLCTGGRVF